MGAEGFEIAVVVATGLDKDCYVWDSVSWVLGIDVVYRCGCRVR